MIDSWLEMDNPMLAKECEKLGIEVSEKHIDNIQNLFDYLKKFEAEIENKLKEESS